MKTKNKWTRLLFIIGVIALLAGMLDPLEGSVVILGGSFLIVVSSYLERDHYRKGFLSSFILIAIGVFFLFYLSSLGGLGGKTGLSWWWGTLLLPYPAGWILTIILVIIRITRKKSKTRDQ